MEMKWMKLKSSEFLQNDSFSVAAHVVHKLLASAVTTKGREEMVTIRRK